MHNNFLISQYCTHVQLKNTHVLYNYEELHMCSYKQNAFKEVKEMVLKNILNFSLVFL